MLLMMLLWMQMDEDVAVAVADWLVMVVLEVMENDGALGGDNVVVLVRTYICTMRKLKPGKSRVMGDCITVQLIFGVFSFGLFSGEKD